MQKSSPSSARPQVTIFTDGACRGNPGPGGWGALLLSGEHEKELNGFEAETTNNQMELRAVIEALRALRKPSDVTLWTDSTYVQKGMSEWIYGWQKNNWKTASKKTVKNKELWQALIEQSAAHNITWKWVKGHAGHPENERVDQLAVAAIDANIA